MTDLTRPDWQTWVDEEAEACAQQVSDVVEAATAYASFKRGARMARRFTLEQLCGVLEELGRDLESKEERTY
jgi:hypothetical protein